MSAWLALTKKEFRLGLPVFLIAVVLFSGSIIFGYLLGNYYGVGDILLFVAFGFVLTMHLLFLLFYLFYSLNYERKMIHLWLHNPMSIAGLLASKIVTGIIYMGITFSISMFLFYQTFENWYIFSDFISFNNFILVISLTVFYIGLLFAFSFLVFWSIFLSLSQRINDFLSFILAFMIFSFVAYWYQFFIGLDFMQTLTNWGDIQVNDILIGFEFTADAFEAGATSEMSILYIGQIIRDLIAAAVMFVIACYIIDKKVEV